MAEDHADQELDQELEDLPAELRWREWMRRIEAVLFTSASPVPREDLARVVGQGVSVDLLIDDLMADLEARSFELAKVADGWMLRTRSAYAAAIRTSICANTTSRCWPLSPTTSRSPGTGSRISSVRRSAAISSAGCMRGG